MKKLIIFLVLFVATACIAAWQMCKSDNDVVISDIVLNNIEALASKPPVVKDCPGGRHLCAKGPNTTLYDKEGPNDI